MRAAIEEEEAARLLDLALENTRGDQENAEVGLRYAIASQEVLAELWLTPEEDAAWQYLSEEI